MKTVMVSGGFDLVHMGHLQLFEEAKTGDHLIDCRLNKFLEEKKNFVFMPFIENKLFWVLAVSMKS